jgi:hypothetical protein
MTARTMAAEPYTDVATHVRDELRRVWLRFEYQIRTGWRKETGLAAEDMIGRKDMGYELTGGFIKVARERAAYVAGANGVEFDEAVLHATIERMDHERGKLSTIGPLE